MLRLTTLILCFVMGAVDYVAAQSPPQKSESVTTRGVFSCKSFLQEVAAGYSGQEVVGYGVLWMMGYLSGRNVYRNQGKDVLASVDPELARDWAISYCRRKPSDDLLAAADALFDQVSKK